VTMSNAVSTRFNDRPEDCGKCLRGIPHTSEEHERTLRRNDEASAEDPNPTNEVFHSGMPEDPMAFR